MGRLYIVDNLFLLINIIHVLRFLKQKNNCKKTFFMDWTHFFPDQIDKNSCFVKL